MQHMAISGVWKTSEVVLYSVMKQIVNQNEPPKNSDEITKPFQITMISK